jgi:hypothetical protein
MRVIAWVMLAPLLSAGAGAQAADARSRALAPCAALAAHVRGLAADPARFQAALAAEGGLLAPRVVIARAGDPELAARAAEAFELAGEAPQVQALGGGVWRVSTTDGTLRCEDDHFFRVGASGALTAVPTPAAYSDLCYRTGRDAATVDGRPAVVEIARTDTPVAGMDVEITPWANGWRAACGLSIRYTEAFRVSERFCADPQVCAEGAGLAVRLATAFARRPEGGGLTAFAPPTSPRAKAAAASMPAIRRGFEDPRGVLPTFGAKARTEFPEYSDTSEMVVVAVAGEPLVAQVGVGGVGWRPLGDLLIALYRPGPRGGAPIAGYVVRREVTGLRDVRVSIPKSYVDPR